MKRSTAIFAAVCLATGASAASAATVLTDGAHQGGNGNKGVAFRPMTTASTLADFVISARSHVDPTDAARTDPNAVFQTGTVYMDTAGAGVQDSGASGSTGISGAGGDQNEELIFTFDTARLMSSTQFTLVLTDFGNHSYDAQGFNKDTDDPIVFIHTVSNGWLLAPELTIKTYATNVGSSMWMVDLGNLGLTDQMIDSFKVRETYGHSEVNNVVTSAITPVPLPPAAWMGLVTLGGVAFRKLRRRSA